MLPYQLSRSWRNGGYERIHVTCDLIAVTNQDFWDNYMMIWNQEKNK